MSARSCRSDDDADRGFTLIELLVVIMIIGILAMIAIPVYLHQRQRGYDASVRSDLHNAATAEESYLTDYDAYSAQTPVSTDLKSQGFKYSTGSDYQGGTASITTHLDPTGGAYCLTATSESGKVLTWQSSAGGLLPDGIFCAF